MPSQRFRIAALFALATTAAVLTTYAQTANDDPPRIPYGTQETLKLNAIVEAAPFMAASTDRVVTLKQERLRASQQIVVWAFEQITSGRTNQFNVLAEPMKELTSAWVSLCTTGEEKMPMMEFALQTAEQREQRMQALFDAGHVAAAENLAAKRDRISAEIEMIECQRAMSVKK